MAKNRYNFIFILLFFILALILTVADYHFILNSKLRESKQNMLAKINLIEEHFENFEHILNNISQNKELYLVLDEQFSKDFLESKKQVQSLVLMLHSLENLTNINSISIYVKEYAHHLIDDVYFKNFSSIHEEIPQDKIYNSFSESDKILFSGRYIFSPDYLFTPIAYCIAGTSLEALEHSFRKIDGNNPLGIDTRIITSTALINYGIKKEDGKYILEQAVSNSNIYIQISFYESKIFLSMFPRLLLLYTLLFSLLLTVKHFIRYNEKIAYYELKALHAQINPHFLYNSLDVINCIAIENDNTEISDMIKSLVSFYKITLNKGEEMIKLEDELLHINHYINIINLRFANAIKLHIECDTELRKIHILKTILQPIVENAVFHGIFEKEIPIGNIFLNICIAKNILYIKIHDDGIGMSEEKAKQCVCSSSKGYGLKNVANRIRLAYGNRSSLKCISIEGKGTCIIIEIPFKRLLLYSKNKLI